MVTVALAKEEDAHWDGLLVDVAVPVAVFTVFREIVGSGRCTHAKVNVQVCRTGKRIRKTSDLAVRLIFRIDMDTRL